MNLTLTDVQTTLVIVFLLGLPAATLCAIRVIAALKGTAADGMQIAKDAQAAAAANAALLNVHARQIRNLETKSV